MSLLSFPPLNSLFPCLLIVPPLLFMIFFSFSPQLPTLPLSLTADEYLFFFLYNLPSRVRASGSATCPITSYGHSFCSTTTDLTTKKEKQKEENSSHGRLSSLETRLISKQSFSQLSWRWLSCHHVIKVFLTFTSLYKRFKPRESAKYHLHIYSMYAHWNRFSVG